MSASPEETWRRFERTLANKERARLIRIGTIIPHSRWKPKPFKKINGEWTQRYV